MLTVVQLAETLDLAVDAWSAQPGRQIDTRVPFGEFLAGWLMQSHGGEVLPLFEVGVAAGMLLLPDLEVVDRGSSSSAGAATSPVAAPESATTVEPVTPAVVVDPPVSQVFANQPLTTAEPAHYHAECPAGHWGVWPAGGLARHRRWIRDHGRCCTSPLTVWPDIVLSIEEQRAADVEDGLCSCRVCGCTQNAACRSGCWWVEPDLCSSCVVADLPADLPAGRGGRVARWLARVRCCWWSVWCWVGYFTGYEPWQRSSSSAPVEGPPSGRPTKAGAEAGLRPVSRTGLWFGVWPLRVRSRGDAG